MIRQNRAVPILVVITLAWILYLAGCFGAEEATTAATDDPETPTVVATPSPAPIVIEATADALASTEEPFIYVIEDGDLLATIAAKFNVSPDVILRANPALDPSVLIVGDTLRIPGASTENHIEEDRQAAREAGEAIDYVVEDGDSLGAIAAAWTVSLEALVAANPGVDPNTLQIGELLVIPPFGTGIPADELAALEAPERIERRPGDPPISVVVEPGDLLSEYAELYGVTVDEIMAFNRLDDPNALVVGQEVLIPPPSAEPATAETPADG